MANKNIVKVLTKCYTQPVFHPPCPAEIEHFFRKFKKYSYKKGEVILRGGDEPNGIFFIAEGFTRMYFICAEGREFTLTILRPGSFFPAIWLICDTPNLYFFEAITEVTIFKAPKDETYSFLNNNTQVLFTLTRNILYGINSFMTRFPHLMLGNSQEKIASVIVYLAENYAAKGRNNEIKITLSLSHQDIANLAGLSRETTTLEISKLCKQKLITTSYRKLIVKDIRGLETIARLSA